jgi:hypothetical protein
MAVDSWQWTVDKVMRALGSTVLLCCSAVYAETVTFESTATWGPAGAGADYDFIRGGRGEGVSLSDEGFISAGVDSDVSAVFESVSRSTEGIVRCVTLSAETYGAIRFEVSANNGGKYVSAVNGVPVESGFGSGTSLRWRARMAPGSVLKSVSVQYTDSLGTQAGFGSPLLSAASRRRGIQIMPPPETAYFNYPLLMELNLDDTRFSAVRFTSADGVTVLPHWLGSVSLDRAWIWIRIPEIASEGTTIYMYYDCGQDTSDPEVIRTMYEEARAELADPELWSVDGYTVDMETIDAQVVAGMLVHLSSLPQVATVTMFSEDEKVYMPEFSGLYPDPAGNLKPLAKTGSYRRKIVDDAGFAPRILIPGFEFSGDGAEVSLNVDSAGSVILDKVENKKVYYASRDGFNAGVDLELHAIVVSDRKTPALVSRMGLEYQPGSFTLIEPGAGNNLYAGEACLIRWSAQEFEAEYPFIIEYSRDNGKTWLRIDEASNSGVYAWQVPARLGTTMLRIRDKYDSGLVYAQSGVVTIVEPKALIIEESRPEISLPTDTVKPLAVSEAKTLTRSDKISVELAISEYRRDNAVAGEALYDVLIKTGDNPGEDELKDGDLMTIRPAGQIWTELERSRYVIVRVYLRPEEVGNYLRASETGAMRGFRISPAGLGMLADGFSSLSKEKRDYLYDKLSAHTFSREMFEPK